jgi:hypothetical protein
MWRLTNTTNSSSLTHFSKRFVANWNKKEVTKLLDHHNHDTREGLRNLFRDV